MVGYIYLLGVILSILIIHASQLNDGFYDRCEKYKSFPFIFGFLIIILLSFRGEDIGTDTSRYMEFFDNLKYSNSNIFDHRFGYVFIYIMYIFSIIFDSVHVFFLFVTCMLYYSICNLFKPILKPQTFSLFVVFMCFYPFFLNYSSNVIRAGLSLSFALLFISNYLHFRKFNFINLILFFLSISIHKASFIFIFPLLFFKKDTVFLLYFWFFSFVFSFFSELISPVMKLLFDAIPYFKEYYLYFNSDFSESVGYNSSSLFYLRLLGFLPVFLYLYLNKIFKIEFEEKVVFIFNYFLVLNSIYLIFSFIPFSDRIGSYSWLLIPGVFFLLYDAFKIENYFIRFSFVAMVLFFVIASEFYYGYYRELFDIYL